MHFKKIKFESVTSAILSYSIEKESEEDWRIDMHDKHGGEKWLPQAHKLLPIL